MIEFKWTNRNIEDFVQNALNPRVLKDKAFKELIKSLQNDPDFIKARPIIVSMAKERKNQIIAGNQRLMAAKHLSWKEIPVIEVYGASEDKEKEWMLIDNLHRGEWDFDSLANQFDLDILKDVGFDEKQLNKILGMVEHPEDEDFDLEKELENKNEIICKKGDIWQLGSHRLMCGDSTKKEDVERLMDGKKADMVFTDPPYNIASHSRNYAADGKTTKKTYAVLRDSAWDKDFNLEPALENIDAFLKENAVAYICTSQFLIQTIWDWANQYFTFNSYIVWCKPNPTPSLSKRHWTFATELIVYAVRGKHTCNFPTRENFLNHWGYTEEMASNIDFLPEMNYWRINKEIHTENHPTQKPIALIAKPLGFSSVVGDICLDLFLGSGSTLIACENLGRICYGMEIDPKYCDVIIKRWEEKTGKKAVKLL